MKKLAAGLVFLLLAFVLAGCGSKSAALDQSAVLSYAGPISDNLRAGFNSGDYVKFTQDFNAAMKSGVPEAFAKANNVIITVSFQKSGGKEQVAGLYFK